MQPTFDDRRQAGALLAEEIRLLEPRDPVVLGLPRGGVPVAGEVAKALDAPLDVVFVRKLGAPLQAELAIGAVFGSEPPLILRNDEIIRELDLSEADVRAEATRQLALIDERRSTYRQHRPAADIEGKTAIVVDDGAATGATLRVALLGVRGKRPSRLIAAVPVASRSAVARLKEAADEVVCLSAPRNLGAVGYYYADFSEVSDTDVIDLLTSRARSKS